MSRDPSNTLTIRTPRLTLRDFVAADLADVHAFRSDPEVARFMDFAPETNEQSASWLDEAILHNRKRRRHAFNLAIALDDENRVIGWIGIGHSERYPAPDELGFGYALNSRYWNHGYATEAARAIIDFGFRVLNGQRISAWCWEDNHASARVLEKSGLGFERRFERLEPKSGELRPVREYAIRRGIGDGPHPLPPPPQRGEGVGAPPASHAAVSPGERKRATRSWA